jgi:hypothetical protein
MRKILPVLLVAALAATLPGCVRQADPCANDAIGSRIAGPWLGSYEFGEGETQRSPFITTYHADGTAYTTSGRSMGAGDPGRYGLSTTHHIRWEATGPRSIRWRLLHFGHEPDGRLRYISRTHGSVEFDEAFERGTVSFQIEVHAPESLLDPLDPNHPSGEPIFTSSGQAEIRRLHVKAP